MGLKQEVGCVCQAQPQKNPKPDNITTSTSNELRSKGAAPIHAWDTRWITCAYESPNLPSLMHDTCHTLKVRYNTYPGATTTHTATPLWGKNQTTWSLPSTDNSNTAEQLSLSRLILEAVRDLADGLLAPAYPRGPQGLQTTWTHQFVVTAILQTLTWQNLALWMEEESEEEQNLLLLSRLLNISYPVSSVLCNPASSPQTGKFSRSSSNQG